MEFISVCLVTQLIGFESSLRNGRRSTHLAALYSFQQHAAHYSQCSSQILIENLAIYVDYCETHIEPTAYNWEKNVVEVEQTC